MTRMTGPDCVVMCNLINTYILEYYKAPTRESILYSVRSENINEIDNTWSIVYSTIILYF